MTKKKTVAGIVAAVVLAASVCGAWVVFRDSMSSTAAYPTPAPSQEQVTGGGPVDEGAGASEPSLPKPVGEEQVEAVQVVVREFTGEPARRVWIEGCGQTTWIEIAPSVTVKSLTPCEARAVREVEGALIASKPALIRSGDSTATLLMPPRGPNAPDASFVPSECRWDYLRLIRRRDRQYERWSADTGEGAVGDPALMEELEWGDTKVLEILQKRCPPEDLR